MDNFKNDEKIKILEEALSEMSEDPGAGRLTNAEYKLQLAEEFDLREKMLVASQIYILDKISGDMELFRNPETNFIFYNSKLDWDIGHEVKKFPEYLLKISGVEKFGRSILDFIESADDLKKERDLSSPEYLSKKATMLDKYDKMIDELEKIRGNYLSLQEIEEKIRGLL
jgi:hypothetical protein